MESTVEGSGSACGSSLVGERGSADGIYLLDLQREGDAVLVSLNHAQDSLHALVQQVFRVQIQGGGRFAQAVAG